MAVQKKNLEFHSVMGSEEKVGITRELSAVDALGSDSGEDEESEEDEEGGDTETDGDDDDESDGGQDTPFPYMLEML